MKEKDYIVYFRYAVQTKAENKTAAINKATKQINGGVCGSELEVRAEEADEEPENTCPDCGREIGANEKRCDRCSIGQNYA
ncbi:MAG: hypothetical protein WC373_04640 [Smithella sp.]|jgi:hypothetical protein